MRKFLLSTIAVFMSVAMMAIGKGDGTSKANAIDFDWANGHKPALSAGSWYRVSLSPLSEEAYDPTLALYLTNLTDETASVKLTMQAELLGQSVNQNSSYNIAGKDFQLWSRQSFDYNGRVMSLKQLMSAGLKEVYLQLTSNKEIALSAKVYETEDIVDDACTKAKDFNWSGVDVPKGEQWFRLNLSDVKSTDNKLKFVVTNNGGAEAKVSFDMSLDCPASAVIEKDWEIAPGADMEDEFGRVFLDVLKEDYVFLKLTNDQPLTLRVEEEIVVIPPGKYDDFDCASAPELAFDTELDLTAGQHIYKVKRDALLGGRSLASEFYVTNNGATPANLTVETAFTCPVKSTVDQSLVIEGNTTIVKAIKDNVLKSVDVEWVYLRFITDQDLTATVGKRNIDPCANAVPFDWTVGASLAAGESQWYEVDITSLKRDKKHLTLAFTNHSDNVALVNVELALDCNGTIMPITLPIYGGLSIGHTIDYNLLKHSPLNRIYVGLSTDSHIEMAASVKDAIAADPTPCQNALNPEHGVEYTHEANTTHWYKISLDLLESTADYSSLYLSNKGNQRAHVTFGVVTDCQYTPSNRITLPMPTKFDLGLLGPNVLGKLLKELARIERLYSKVDSKDIYLEIQSDQPIGFGLDVINAATSPCLRSDLITFDWNKGAKVEKGDGMKWFDMDLDAVKAAGKHVKLTFTNHSDSLVWAATMVSVECPAKLTMPLLVPVPAGMSVDHVINYQLFAVADLHNIYIGVVTDGELELKAESIDATILPPANCLNAQVIVSGKEYVQNAGTQWYQFPMSLIDEMGSAAKISFKNLTSNHATLSAGVTVGCEYPVNTIAKAKAPRDIQFSLNIPKFIISKVRGLIDPALTDFYIQLTTDQKIAFTLNNQATDVRACSNAIDFDWKTWEQDGLQLEANKANWYKVNFEYVFEKLEKGEDISVGLTNPNKNMDVAVDLAVSPTCPVVLSLEKSVNIPAGTSAGVKVSYDQLMSLIDQYDKYDLYGRDYEGMLKKINAYVLYNKLDQMLTERGYDEYIPLYRIEPLVDRYGEAASLVNLKALLDNPRKYISVAEIKERLEPVKVKIQNEVEERMSFDYMIGLLETYGDKIPKVDAEQIINNADLLLPYIGSANIILDKCKQYISKEDLKQHLVDIVNRIPFDEVKEFFQRVENKLKQYMPEPNTFYIYVKTTGELVINPEIPVAPECEGIVDTIVAEACDTFVWKGIPYTESGIYRDSTSASEPADAAFLDWKQTVKLSEFSEPWYKLDISEIKTNKMDFKLSLENDLNTTLNYTIELYDCYLEPMLSGSSDVEGGLLNRTVTYAEFMKYTDGLECDYLYLRNVNYDCDRFEELHLTINKSVKVDTTIVACDSLEWNGSVYTVSGDYTDTLVAANGCDSIVTLHLTVENCTVPDCTVTGEETVVACDSYDWNGNTYTTSGDYVDTITLANGCDSIVTLHLTINQSVSRDEYVTVCYAAGETINGNDYGDTPGEYTEVLTLTAENGCDSVITYHITVLDEIPETYITEEICEGGSFELGGVIFTQAVVDEPVFLQSVDGCDSLVYVTIIVKDCKCENAVDSVFHVVICEGKEYPWRGQTYTGETHVTVPGTDANGCSINYTLNLTVAGETHYVTACDSYTYEVDGQTFTQTATGTYTHQLAGGCEYVLNLTINHSEVLPTEVVSSCGAYVWPVNGQVYSQTDVYQHHDTTSEGCTLTYTLDLTVTYVEDTVITAVICDGDKFEWRGNEYSVEGTYTDTATINGCEATHTLHLVVAKGQTLTETACDSYTIVVDGKSYTYTESIKETFELANDCDFILDLTINKSEKETYTVTACDSYEWHGTVYEASGEYIYNATTAAGCDRVETLNLTINKSVVINDKVTTCKPYVWEVNGQTYDTTDVYNYTGKTADGCDLTATLDLTIYCPEDSCANAQDSVFNVEICEGDTYYWEKSGKTYPTVLAPTTTDVPFVAGTDNGNSINGEQMQYQISKDGITLDIDGRRQGNEYRIFSGRQLIITSANSNITKVEFICTKSGTTTYGPAGFKADQGTYTYSGKVGTWTGSANEIVFTASPQVRATQIIVTYESDAVMNTVGTDTISGFNDAGCDINYILNWQVVDCSTPDDPCLTAEVVDWRGPIYIPETTGKWYKVDVAEALASGKDIEMTVTNGPVDNDVTMKMSTECFDPASALATTTVKAIVPADWTDQIYVWVWGDDDPGSEHIATKEGDFWTYTHNGDDVNIIFKNGQGWQGSYYQTVDMTFSEDACIQLTADVYGGKATYSVVNCSDGQITVKAQVPADWTDQIYVWVWPTGGAGTEYPATKEGDFWTYTHAGDDVNIIFKNGQGWQGWYYQTEDMTFSEDACIQLTADVYGNKATYQVVDCGNNAPSTVAGKYAEVRTSYYANEVRKTIITQDRLAELNINDYVYVYVETTGSMTITATTVEDTPCENDTVEYWETADCSYTWDVNGVTYDASGDYDYETDKGDGCTLTEILHLTINPCPPTPCEDVYVNVYAEFCGSYPWNGVIYTEGGKYVKTFPLTTGCDSIVTLYLTEKCDPIVECDTVYTEFDAQFCDKPYNWNGQLYDVEGDHVQILKKTDGCDSIVTMHLTKVCEPIPSCEDVYTEFTTTFCGTFVWNKQEYTEAGDYTQVLSKTDGCDSIVTLHLVEECEPEIPGNPCLDAIPFDWTTGAYLAADSCAWYEMDITSLVENKQHLTLTFTNHTDSTAWVYAVFALDCEGKMAPMLFPIPGGLSIDQTIDYQLLKRSPLRRIYVGVCTDADIELASSVESAIAEDPAPCLNATNIEYDVKYVHNPGTSWYKVSTELLKNKSDLTGIYFANKGNKRAHVTVGMVADCQYTTGTTITLPIPTGFEFSVMAPNILGKLMRELASFEKAINELDVKEIYVEITTDETIEFELSTREVNDACETAIELDWKEWEARGLQLKANEEVWYAVNVNYLLEKFINEKEITLVVSNLDSVDVDVEMSLSPTCPVMVTLDKTFTVPAGMSAKKILNSDDMLQWLAKYEKYVPYEQIKLIVEKYEGRYTVEELKEMIKNYEKYISVAQLKQELAKHKEYISYEEIVAELKKYGEYIPYDKAKTLLEKYEFFIKYYAGGAIALLDKCEPYITMDNFKKIVDYCSQYIPYEDLKQLFTIFKDYLTNDLHCYLRVKTTGDLYVGPKPLPTPCVDVVEELTVEACESYEWKGYTFTQSGQYTESKPLADPAKAEFLDWTQPIKLSEFTEPWYKLDVSDVIANKSDFSLLIENEYDSTLNVTLELYNDPTDWFMYSITKDVEPGTYPKTLTYAEFEQNIGTEYDVLYLRNVNYDCELVEILNLTINNSVETEDYVEACGDYTWNGVVYNMSGDYTQTLSTVNGCDSIVTLHLTILPTDDIVTNVAICEGESYTWDVDDVTYTGTSYVEVAGQNDSGCDVTYILNLIVMNQDTIDVTVCDGPYVIEVGGVQHTFDQSGAYAISNGDCATVLNLTINQSQVVEYTEVACGSYTWHGNTYTSSGDYTFIGTTDEGCELTEVLYLTINPAEDVEEYVSICEGESYTWPRNGQTYNETTTATFVGANDYGCEVTYTLHVEVIANEYKKVTACDSYTHNGVTYTESGVYTVTNGTCKLTLDLTINETGFNYYDEVACDSYEWNGNTYTESGIYYNYGGFANGCPLVEVLRLTINKSEVLNSTVTTCEPYEWYGKVYDQTGKYTYSGTTADGCSLEATLDLTIFCPTPDPVEVFDTIAEYVCDGTEYVDPNTGKKHIISSLVPATLTWDEVVTTADTIYYYHYVITPIVAPELLDDAALALIPGATPVLTQGLVPDVTGTTEAIKAYYVDNDAEDIADVTAVYWDAASLTVQVACGAVTHTMNLVVETECDNVLTSTHTFEVPALGVGVEENVTICAGETYTWNGKTYNATGTYEVTLTGATGCDSIATLNLTVLPAIAETVTEVTLCAGESYTWEVTGTIYNATTTESIVLKSVNGCDSVVTLNLTVLPAIAETVTEVTICAGESYTWDVTGTTYDATTTESIVLKSVNDCDSVVTLKLTVLPVIPETTDEATICAGETYTWSANGKTYNTTTTETITLTSVNGCDSVVTLNLTVLPEIPETTENVTICYGETYTWVETGKAYTTTTTESVTLKSVNGCDSVVTLNLVVLPEIPVTEEVDTICAGETYTWSANGKTYTTTTTESVTLTAANGCDSVVTLKLTVLDPIAETVEYATVCAGETYTWSVNGKTYNATTTESVTLKSVNGCDSVVTLNLTVLPEAVTETEDLVVCESELPYVWRGEVLSAAGTYTVVEQYEEFACDSVIHVLNLQVYTLTLPASVADPIAVCGNPVDVTAANADIDAHIASNLYAPNATVTWYIMKNGTWTALTDELLKGSDESVTLKYIITTDCGSIESERFENIPVEMPTPINDVDMDNLPVESKYGHRVLLLNLNAIMATHGWTPEPEEVKWYRVVNDLDVYGEPGDDEFTGVTGHYFNYVDASVMSGQYYALIVHNTVEHPDECELYMRTEVITCSSNGIAPRLLPNVARPNENMKLVDLNPEEITEIRVYSTTGELMDTYVADQVAEFIIKAAQVSGYYMVDVETQNNKVTLRYVVK